MTCICSPLLFIRTNPWQIELIMCVGHRPVHMHRSFRHTDGEGVRLDINYYYYLHMDGWQGDYVGQLTTAILYINQRYNQHTDNKWGYVGGLTTAALDINY